MQTCHRTWIRDTYSTPTPIAVNREAAEGEFEEFAERWEATYPALIRSWREAWEEFTPFLDFPGVDPPHPRDQLLPVLPRGQTQTVAHEMDHAGLDPGLGLDRVDRLGHALEPIAAHDELNRPGFRGGAEPPSVPGRFTVFLHASHAATR